VEICESLLFSMALYLFWTFSFVLFLFPLAIDLYFFCPGSRWISVFLTKPPLLMSEPELLRSAPHCPYRRGSLAGEQVRSSFFWSV